MLGPDPLMAKPRRSQRTKKRAGPTPPEQVVPTPTAPEAPVPVPAPIPATPQPPAGEAGSDEKETLDGLISALEAARESRVLVYWTSPLARISDAAVMPLHDQLTSIGKTDRLDLLLQTGGGDTEMPWRMVSLIREYCGHFGVLVPHRSASAGTMIAMGADEIVMTPLSVLGPIDPSRSHPLLPRREGEAQSEPISVQDMRHAMQFIREAAGSDKEMPYTPEAMAQIFAALFDKIHPLAIGAIEQSYALSKLVGTRCLETHMDPEKEAPQIKAIVDTLCDEFKSHQYQIPRREARRIGLKVKDASDEEEAAITNLLKFYLARPFLPASPPTPGQVFEHTIAWLDSTSLHMRVDAQAQVAPDGQFAPKGDQWVSY